MLGENDYEKVAWLMATKRFGEAGPPSTLRAQVVQQLREDILSGRYKPGDRLNESSIAREFGISRIPVREALFEIREVGLVMNREHKGMFVTSLSEEEVEQINAVRMILEAEALRLAKEKMTPRVATALKNMVEKMESTRCTVSEAAALDLEFHRTIWAICGNEYLRTILEPLAALSFAHSLLERVGRAESEWRLAHHRPLLEAVLGRGEHNIGADLREHLKSAYLTEQPVPAGPSANGGSRPSMGRKRASRKSVRNPHQ